MELQSKQQIERNISQHSIDDYLELCTHGKRVSLYSVFLGKLLKLNKDAILKLKIAAQEHDTGKIFCPPQILNKTGPLTDSERIILQKHSNNSAIFYEKNCYPAIDIEIRNGIKHHHENYDGTGYPDNLVGENIPYISRIIRIADSFDALTQARCYKKAVSCQEALSAIWKEKTWYDPNMLQTFTGSFDKFVTLFENER